MNIEDIKYAQDILKCTLTTQTSFKKFRSFFGIGVSSFAKLVRLLKVDSKETKHIFWTAFWLKNYCTESVCTVVFSTSEKTFRECVRTMLEKIFNLDLINFDDRFINWPHLVPSCSLDGNYSLI
jgi:hypothetical protein